MKAIIRLSAINSRAWKIFNYVLFFAIFSTGAMLTYSGLRPLYDENPSAFLKTSQDLYIAFAIVYITFASVIFISRKKRGVKTSFNGIVIILAGSFVAPAIYIIFMTFVFEVNFGIMIILIWFLSYFLQKQDLKGIEGWFSDVVDAFCPKIKEGYNVYLQKRSKYKEE